MKSLWSIALIKVLILIHHLVFAKFKLSNRNKCAMTTDLDLILNWNYESVSYILTGNLEEKLGKKMSSIVPEWMCFASLPKTSVLCDFRMETSFQLKIMYVRFWFIIRFRFIINLTTNLVEFKYEFNDEMTQLSATANSSYN